MNEFRITHLRHLLGVGVVLISLIAVQQANGASRVRADMPSTTALAPAAPTPVPPDKNSPQSKESDARAGSFAILSPEPFSKNSSVQPVIENSIGETGAAVPNPGSKNYEDRIQSATLPEDIAAMLTAGGLLIPCGESGNLNFTTTSSSYVAVRQCTLLAPQDGWLFIAANSSAARQDGEYEAQFDIGMDSTSGDGSIDRWVNVYDDSGDGTDESVVLSVLKPVTAGTHTVYFLSKRYTGTGTVLLYDPALTVIFIPTADSQVLACGESGNLNFTTTSSSYAVVRHCMLAVAQDGWVFISADSSVARQDGEYEAQFDIGMDSTSGDGSIDRWVNIYNDSGDGTDKSVALSVLKPVTVGLHTINFLGKRYSGTGTVLLYDPALTVIFIPAAESHVLACGVSGNLNFTTTSSSYAVVRQCTLAVPQDGWVFISADSSVSRQDGEYEAQFDIGMDSTSGDGSIDRWVNIYNDSGDGTDKSVALSVLKPVTAGTHTIYFLSKRYSGTGTVLLYDPALTVIAPGAQIYLPLVMKGT